jgi:ketosteroid isomerase-like protein
METPSPLDVVTQLVSAMNKSELESALSLFEPGASFVVRPGVVVNGASGIRQALAGFMALKPALAIEAQQIVEAGDVAQYCARWTIRGTDSAGNAVHMSGRSSSILRRQFSGTWLFLLDNPWGTDIVA